MKAVVLLSGGLDSATALAVARAAGCTSYCMSFAYGQRHSIELERAAQVAHKLGAAEHRVVTIDLRAFGASALTADIPVPKDRPEMESIPITYVPARNTIFLAFALGWAEVLGARAIYLGINALDYSGYPDCRPEYLRAYQSLADLATRQAVEGDRVELRAPLLHLSKAEIISLGTELGVDYTTTLSCYDPDAAGLACGHCDSCRLRARGFEAAGIPDPTQYRPSEPS